jgi:23S rRNA pseudouridine1911/1915/1917 synthase
MPKIIITKEEAGQRIDQALTDRFDFSRSKIQKLIKSEEVTVNNEAIKTKYLLEENDEIFFPEPESLAPPKKTGEAPVLDVLYEDDDLMVINKPAGLIVHDAMEDSIDPSVVDGVLALHPEIQNVGEDSKRPGIVHRLDKDVSGTMVVAKTQEMFEALKDQFKTRTVGKEYLALVYGHLPKDHDTIKLKIARSSAKGRMVARTGDQEGKDALTEYDVLEEFKNNTYAKIKTHTGRTHQIRVHLYAIDHPLVGDKLYKKKKMRHVRPVDINRIFLHAHKLSIQLKDKTKKTFISPLPEELDSLLKKLPKT